MKSNSFFSFNRFTLLLRNDLLLNYKKYLLAIAGAFILCFMVLYIMMPNNFIKGEPISIYGPGQYEYTFGICIFGLLAFVGSAFADFSSKPTTFNFLQMPASAFEKYLSQFLIYGLAGTAIFFIIFWIDAHLARFVVLSNMKYTNGEIIGADKYNYIEEFSYYSMFFERIPAVFLDKKGIYWYKTIMSFITIFSAGVYLFNVKVAFRKFGLIKSALSFVVLIFLIYVVMRLFSHLYFPEKLPEDISGKLDYILQNGLSNTEIWMSFLACIAPLFLIPFGYFKLKEKQL